MSCRRVSRALLEHFRFGEELDERCDEYLEHVETCRQCQHDVAVDRAMATHLRRALRERVEGFEPSPAVWRAVRLVAADPEPPQPWYHNPVAAMTRAMRVMVPVSALMLAVALGWSTGQSSVSDAASGRPDLASSLQWHEQLNATAALELPHDALADFIPTPAVQLPRPSGDTPYAELQTAVKVYDMVPPSGGVIR
ncbi:MAG TPA: hypothetical protein VF013_10385 [Candidatus Limnocylindria bacterium]